MKRSMLVTALALVAFSTGTAAQAHGTHSPHAGKEARAVKSLSAEEVEDFLAGRGMGMALAAELNGHPGPRHVLDLADPLGLSDDQAARIRVIFEEMQRDAAALGRRYVELERRLDRGFAERTMDMAALRALTAEIGRTRGELMNVHLRAHIQTTALLTPEQIRPYDHHRGYAAGHGAGHGPGSQHR